MKIDTSSWKPFKLGGEDGLFKIIKGTRLTKQQMVPGEINYIGATAFNNGITGKIGNTDSIHQPPCLTVAYNGSLGETFYQQSPFWATDDCNILQPKFNLTENVAFFLIPLIKNEGKKYAYNDKWKLEEMEKAILLLPSTPDEKPDWLYMERYISELRIKAQLSVNQLVKLGGGKSRPINITSWKPFKLGGKDGLFDIVKGNRLTKQEMIKGETPYIGATAFNNGVTNTIGNRENLHPAGVLTVAYDGSIGQTFFQIKEFWASDAVNILYPKFTLFPEVAYYLATLIRIAGKKYGYNDKWKLKVMKDTEIPLPTTPDGKPDWKYMTDYVAALKRNVDNNLAPLDLFQL